MSLRTTACLCEERRRENMITPSQIREKNLSTVQSGGYDKEEVNALLAQIVESYQAVYDELFH